MSALLPFLTLDQSSEQVQAWVRQHLIKDGFRVVQTFDLRDARLAHPDCPCPHHGTEACTCQMVVLLVYRKRGEPVTVVIHGQDDRTWLSVAGSTGKRSNQRLEAAVRRILTIQFAWMPPLAEVTYEPRFTA